MGLLLVGNTNPAAKEGDFKGWTRIHVQVRDASTIYLATDRKALEVPGPGNTQGGLSITSADGIKTLDWKGPLFVKGSTPNALYDLEAFADEYEAIPCN